MHIIGLFAENYKKLRVVEITPKGRVVQITGKNGQGKTSVLDAIWAALQGAKAIPERPVRKGSERAKIKLNLGEFVVTRTINSNGNHTLMVENAKGVKCSSPQAILDELLGSLTFDPLQFVSMKPPQQVEMLREVSQIELDIDLLNAENKKDFEDRTAVNREVRRLEGEVASITIQEGLPKEKQDEKSILGKLTNAGEANKQAQELFLNRQKLNQAVETAVAAEWKKQEAIAELEREISDLEKQLEARKLDLREANLSHQELVEGITAARRAFLESPEPVMTDVSALTAELQQIQLVNREIDKRTKRENLEKQLGEERRKADNLTRAIEGREEQKKNALQNAKMPVEGLTFDEDKVMFNGIPIEQLGEAEQIRISTSIAMAANPKLRILRILHGEAMDEDSLKVIADMAEANDFQVWMSKVDSSGKVGIVMEDGMVKDDQAEEA